MADTIRARVVSIAKEYVGISQGSPKHKAIVNIFNAVRPHGNVMNYTAPWCACFASVVLYRAGFSPANAPMSYNCGTLISDAKRLGCWVENDNYLPQAGDLVIYNWSASAGECTTGADHVGVVEKVSGSTITVIEGNMGKPSHCGRRSFTRGYRYIRGFITPKYASPSTWPGSLPSKLIKYGSKGKQVEYVQAFINWTKLSPKVKVDGIWGKATEAAVLKWCKKVGLVSQSYKGRIEWGSKCTAKAKTYKR